MSGPAPHPLVRALARDPARSIAERDWSGLVCSLILGFVVAGTVLSVVKLLTLIGVQ
jgi:hypothetical protein